MIKKKNYNARPSYITVWNQQVIYIFIPWKFLISLKFHEKRYERTWCIWEKTNHLIRDKQAEMCSQLWNTWRSGKAHETSSGRSPPASVTTSPSVSSFRHKTVLKQTLSVNGEDCDCYKHSQLYEWEIHHSNASKGKRCKMDPRIASMA